MSERQAPWRAKPSLAAAELLQQLPERLMFMVHRSGPTAFVVREDGSEVKRRVVIGARPSCSCQGGSANQALPEPCMHILFVLVKVLRLNPDNPLVWQISLTDRELEEVLRAGSRAVPASHAPPAAGGSSQGTAAGKQSSTTGGITRRPVEEEEPCPICYEGMQGQDEVLLVWCKSGCGRNVHGRCMRVWAEHQTDRLQKELTCPLCRTPWGEFNWRPPPPPRRPLRRRQPPDSQIPATSAAHEGTTCAACRVAPIRGQLYRCTTCSHYDLCDACFGAGHHPQHSFAYKATPTALPQAARRPEMMPAAVRLNAPYHMPALALQPEPAGLQPSPAAAPPPAAAVSAGRAGHMQHIGGMQAYPGSDSHDDVRTQRVQHAEGIHTLLDGDSHADASRISLDDDSRSSSSANMILPQRRPPSHPVSARSAPVASLTHSTARPLSATLLEPDGPSQSAVALMPMTRRISAPTTNMEGRPYRHHSTGDNMQATPPPGSREGSNRAGSGHSNRTSSGRVILEPLPAGVGPPVPTQQRQRPHHNSKQALRRKAVAGPPSGRLQPLGHAAVSTSLQHGAFSPLLALEGRNLQASHLPTTLQAQPINPELPSQGVGRTAHTEGGVSAQPASHAMQGLGALDVLFDNEQVHHVAASGQEQLRGGPAREANGQNLRVRAGRKAGLPPASGHHAWSRASPGLLPVGERLETAQPQGAYHQPLQVSGRGAAPAPDEGLPAAQLPPSRLRQHSGHIRQGLTSTGLNIGANPRTRLKLNPRAAAAAAAIARAEAVASAAVACTGSPSFHAVGVAVGSIGGVGSLATDGPRDLPPLLRTCSLQPASTSARTVLDCQQDASASRATVLRPSDMALSHTLQTHSSSLTSVGRVAEQAAHLTQTEGRSSVASAADGVRVLDRLNRSNTFGEASERPSALSDILADSALAVASPVGADLHQVWNRVFSNPAFGRVDLSLTLD